jgi:uncharacterized iron-regulated protein
MNPALRHGLRALPALAVLIALSGGAPARETGACMTAGQWSAPASPRPRPLSPDMVAATSRDARFVLLGEYHDQADHHRWQLHTLGMLLAERGKLVIGMEMLPRRAQPVLDRWVAGELTEAELLRETQWNRVWGYDAELYLPILHFARLHRVSLVALNVDRSLTREVGAKGWAAIGGELREGVSDPAPPAAEYRALLRRLFEEHPSAGNSRASEAFDRFMEAQLLWDRAFAEALFAASVRQPEALVVGIIGSGHLQGGYGVSHQLRALGARAVKVWLPVDASATCNEIEPGMADALFAVESSRAPATPRLGVLLDDDRDGPRVREVVAGSVAERAGVQPGDRLVAAAGLRLASAADLISTVKKQPPGTWLPLKVERSGQELDLVAKFPAPVE